MSTAKSTVIGLIISIITTFVVFGVFIPSIQEAVGVASSSHDFDDLQNTIGDSTGSESAIKTAFTIPEAIIKMFFWHFGVLPEWLNGLFWIMRATLVLCFVFLFRGVG